VIRRKGAILAENGCDFGEKSNISLPEPAMPNQIK
jgi:hypothetical protein